jgi:tRNA-dihydrouridine synthase
MYAGLADWTLIGKVKANPRMHIPIIGNGDITDPEMAFKRFEETGVDAIMIGRGCIGRPWLFEEIKYYLATGQLIQPGANSIIKNQFIPYSFEWKREVLKQLIVDSVRRLDERRGIIYMRRHLAATPLLKGIPHFKETRVAILRAETVNELFRLLDSIQ